MENTQILAMVSSGSSLFAGTAKGIFYSTYRGNTWTLSTHEIPGVSSFAIKDTVIFAGTVYHGVFRSTDNGINWSPYNYGIDYTYDIYALSIKDSYIFAGTANRVWRRIYSQITSVDLETGYIPTNIKLYQNFPNPFNPTTNISYSISQPGIVSIIVYDILGRKVATLLNEEKNTGNYSIDFDGVALSSGIYFYQLKVNDFIETKKMVLLR
jgi:hypothetical protein